MADRSRQAVPQGLEIALMKAAVGPAFQDDLLDRRSTAAKDAGLTLATAEADILDSVPREQLEAMIRRTEVPAQVRGPLLERRDMAAIIAAFALVGVSIVVPSLGSRPDMPDGSRSNPQETSPPANRPPVNQSTSQPVNESTNPRSNE